MNSKQVVILRGIPGSGKTHYARSIPGAVVCSADAFFTTGGVYRYDPKRIQAAHDDCLRRFLAALQAGSPLVVVDNTNIGPAEFAPYYRLALALGYAPKIVTIRCDPAVAAGRNVHGVPDAVVAAMAARIVDGDVPARWRHEVVAAS